MAAPGFNRALLALIVGQVSLHACMAGVRMAVPLEALRLGQPTWLVGLLLALFAAAPIVFALHAGRMTDRHGYHRPVLVGIVATMAGAACALASTHVLARALAATLAGAGANFGLMAIQRTAGRMAGEGAERIRVFSWLGLAPALANIVGPVTAGLLIDAAGFRAAFAALMLLPLAALASARLVPRETPPAAAHDAKRTAWDLLRSPQLRRLLFINWLISASWDAHSFLVPVLGHERDLSAAAIGLVLGAFATAVTGVRFLIPFVAQRLAEGRVLRGAAWLTAVVFAAYPLAHTGLAMAAFATVLGVALGAVQPMVMSLLHRITPDDRHGEAIALRSMAINASSAMMPMLFGAVGGVLGPALLFWAMAALVAGGSFRVTGLPGRGSAAS